MRKRGRVQKHVAVGVNGHGSFEIVEETVPSVWPHGMIGLCQDRVVEIDVVQTTQLFDRLLMLQGHYVNS